MRDLSSVNIVRDMFLLLESYQVLTMYYSGLLHFLYNNWEMDTLIVKERALSWFYVRRKVDLGFHYFSINDELVIINCRKRIKRLRSVEINIFHKSRSPIGSIKTLDCIANRMELNFRDEKILERMDYIMDQAISLITVYPICGMCYRENRECSPRYTGICREFIPESLYLK